MGAKRCRAFGFGAKLTRGVRCAAVHALWWPWFALGFGAKLMDGGSAPWHYFEWTMGTANMDHTDEKIVQASVQLTLTQTKTTTLKRKQPHITSHHITSLTARAHTLLRYVLGRACTH